VTDFVAVLAMRLGRVGIDLVGATSVAAYDARMPTGRTLGADAGGARGVVVAGNGGRAFWDAFRADGRCVGDDPLDAFTRRVVEDAVRDLPGATCRFPFEPAPRRLDFRLLAELAGLGRPSLVGVLVHPVYGPWIALRAAILVPDDVTAPRPADGFDPCPSCVERPCIVACPAGVVGPSGWDVAGCAAHRLAAVAHCADGCAARIACVYGRAHHYPPDALAFHQASARRTMAAYASAAKKA